MEDYEKIKIGFTYQSLDSKEEYSATSVCSIIPDFDGELDIMFRQFNSFLRQMSYVRNNDFILQDDLTEDEMNELHNYLVDLRKKKSEEEKDE